VNKIVTLEELKTLRAELAAAGKTVVQCHGCFDIVHPGHIRHLSFARAQGDALIVTITADRSIEKGFDRPYIHEGLRAENVAALACVDFVCVDESESAQPVLEALQPDIFVKGKEYETNLHPHFLEEKALVEGYGGKVIYSSGDVVYSSTYIINEFRERFDFEQERISAYCAKNELSADDLEETLAAMAGRKVLVLGDPIFDHYVHCDALGVAAEGPVLNVAPLSEEAYVGAGALVAAQMAALGAKPTFLTVLGPGSRADRFLAKLDGLGVEHAVVSVDDRPVFKKTRFLVDEHKVFKVNRGWPSPLSSIANRKLVAALDDLLPEHEALTVIDFGYGLYQAELVAALERLTTRHERPYYVDVSNTRHADILRFKGQRIGTPTEDELRSAFNDHEAGLSNLASRYYEETGGDQLVLTLGKKGALTFSRPPGSGTRLIADYLPALSRVARDPVGAGDVFHAATVLADLAGASIQRAVYLASCLSAIHVRRVGNGPVSLLDVQDYLAARPELTD